MTAPTEVYLSGCIAGDPTRTFQEKRDLFRSWADWLHSRGISPLDPFDVRADCDEYCQLDLKMQHFSYNEYDFPDGSVGYEHTWQCYLRHDLVAMLSRCDRIIMLPRWELSPGARLEHQVAIACGLKELRVVHDAETLLPVRFA